MHKETNIMRKIYLLSRFHGNDTFWKEKRNFPRFQLYTLACICIYGCLRSGVVQAEIPASACGNLSMLFRFFSVL